MFCTHCGQQSPDDATFCARCGQRINNFSAEPGPPRRLFRLRNGKKIAGICAGLAKHLDVDVTLVRIITIAATCVSGFVPGVIAYVLIWMIMPLEEYYSPAVHNQPASSSI